MIGLVIVVSIAFLLIPKRPIHFGLLILGVVLTLSATGPQVVERFASAFASEKDRDASADSRVKMWGICLEQIQANPVIGLGPHHFPVFAHTYGLTRNKEAHTTWLQVAAEIGLPGVVCLLLFYLIPVIRMWPMTRESYPVADPWFRDTARMVVAAVTGFLVTAQFVTLPGLEVPYFVVLLGAGVLKLHTAGETARRPSPYAAEPPA
jgi:hypothetical protein